MIIVAEEVLPVGSKPPAAISVRISTGERHDFGAVVPMSTKTSSLRGRAGDSAFIPKLVELVGPAWTLFADNYPHASLELQQRRPPCARESSCLLLRLPPWRDVVAERPAQGLLDAVLSLSSPPQPRPLFSAVFQIFLEKVDIHPPAWVGRPEFFLLGDGAIALRDNLAPVPWHVRVNSTSRNTIALVC